VLKLDRDIDTAFLHRFHGDRNFQLRTGQRERVHSSLEIKRVLGDHRTLLAGKMVPKINERMVNRSWFVLFAESLNEGDLCEA
jgi:hypothetical protein